MSNYFISGSTVTIGKDADLEIGNELPAGTYTVAVTRAGFELNAVDDFTLPEKIYGNVDGQCARILSTFEDRPSTTGVHLSGVKGSGKTLLVRQLSKTALEMGYPTLIINQALCGEAFNDFMQSIDTPCIVIFDEFEKTYDNEAQEKILTLFDGVYQSKKLFVLTTNNERRVSEFLKNRPGRMYYKFEYETLAADTVLAVLEDRLNDKSQIPSIVRYTKIFSFINFDMLVAITEEMNRYGETLAQVLKVLNIREEFSEFDRYDLLVRVGQTEVTFVEKLRFDMNAFSYCFSNEDLYDRWRMTQKEHGPCFDSDDCPDFVMIDDFKLMLNEFSSADVEADDLVRFDESTDTFEFQTTYYDQPITVLVRKRNWSMKSGSSSKLMTF